MANDNDTKLMQMLMNVPDNMKAEFFRQNAHKITDDSNYWNVLGTLWKLGGTVVQQELWKELFLAPRKKRHKIMKNKERSVWRRLPKTVTAYRAVNDESEIETAISWTLCRNVAEKFSQDGERKVVTREFKKSDVFAYFNRRNEDEILVNLAI